jgi:hypothetical protein
MLARRALRQIVSRMQYWLNQNRRKGFWSQPRRPSRPNKLYLVATSANFEEQDLVATEE